MINFLKEIESEMEEYNIEFRDLIIIDKGKRQYFKNREEFEKKYDFEYDDGFGTAKITNFQIIIDDYTWLERDSYDGAEGFVIKAHPLKSKYQTIESHMG